MSQWLHRTDKTLLDSVAVADLPEPEANYIEAPDLSAVAGQPPRYWTITGDVVTLQSPAERATTDAAILEASRDEQADQLDLLEDVLRAFALVVLDEINVLRVNQHALAPRTIAQLKAAVRGKLGT